MEMTAYTKSIIDNNINSLRRSCDKRTEDPQLLSVCYTELLKNHKMQDMEKKDIPYFIDSLVNVNYNYSMSKYNLFNKKTMEMSKHNFVDEVVRDDESITRFTGERNEAMENDKTSDKHWNPFNYISYDNRLDLAYQVIDEAFKHMDIKDGWYYKILFKKYYIENYTYQQIQDQTGIPKQSVHNAVQRALGYIHHYIDENYGGIDNLKEKINIDQWK